MGGLPNAGSRRAGRVYFSGALGGRWLTRNNWGKPQLGARSGNPGGVGVVCSAWTSFFKRTVEHEKSLAVLRLSRTGPGGSEHERDSGTREGVRRAEEGDVHFFGAQAQGFFP